MRKLLSVTVICSLGCLLFFTACKKAATNETSDQTAGEIDQASLDAIYQLGFSNKNVSTDEDGNYLVEGDIVISRQDLQAKADMRFLRIGNEEQYRTNNLVSALPRTIRVSLANQLPSSYVAALDEALARYNAQGLRITFTRVSSGANISIVRGNGNYLASAGFPTSGGNPYGQIKVNARAIGNQPQSTVASILAHEIGHCIGFRHTDYMDRSFSCGGQPVNEGASTIGAVYIPGTAAGPDPNSWMLSCIGSGQNRPFNANDRTALNYLYK
ncbi:M57 family metalloprotease [Paraflavitalea sp. CAU 1676]|uniref:M57 family metalloprotease n=1 Tax=Paraflavitalea sp. CAU 1676 TaxID=3032598 RepID=UPI0023DCB416|nr:M57 family metalloprotease [Paraflavitalea sp. CAU 1676]MDF2191727.1 M57 family metalloprotease [Paraflavitalea sp. CAU 1676]